MLKAYIKNYITGGNKMKSIKFAKVIGLTLAITTAVTMLVGCGGSTSSTDSTKAATDQQQLHPQVRQ